MFACLFVLLLCVAFTLCVCRVGPSKLQSCTAQSQQPFWNVGDACLMSFAHNTERIGWPMWLAHASYSIAISIWVYCSRVSRSAENPHGITWCCLSLLLAVPIFVGSCFAIPMLCRRLQPGSAATGLSGRFGFVRFARAQVMQPIHLGKQPTGKRFQNSCDYGTYPVVVNVALLRTAACGTFHASFQLVHWKVGVHLGSTLECIFRQPCGCLLLLAMLCQPRSCCRWLPGTMSAAWGSTAGLCARRGCLLMSCGLLTVHWACVVV